MTYWQIVKLVFKSDYGIKYLSIIICGAVVPIILGYIVDPKFMMLINMISFVLVMYSITMLFSKIIAMYNRQLEAEKEEQAKQHSKKKKK